MHNIIVRPVSNTAESVKGASHSHPSGFLHKCMVTPLSIIQI